MSPQLTIGMATYNDFDGVYFTLQSLHATQPRKGVTYMVIDNAPQRCLRTESVARAVGGRYFHRPDLNGTSKPRDALFRYASTPWVMCVDSHIVLETGALGDFLSRTGDQRKFADCLIQGPVIRDDGKVLGTHWDQPSPPGMWGEWRIDGIGDDPTHDPYEIKMQGLGLFAMRKDRWPGFNYFFRGFGGEEGYIHEKVRRQGGIAVSFPLLRWRHRFRDVHGGWALNPTPYPAYLKDHVFNLLVGHREFGIDAVQQIYDHFGKNLAVVEWEQVLKECEIQPFGEAVVPQRQKLLAVWYSDNTAPHDLLIRSLRTIENAQAMTMRHSVDVVTCPWKGIPGNPFKQTIYSGEHKRSHETLLNQIHQAIANMGGSYDAILFMEHDVLYPANYFDRVGDAFALNPQAPVVSNLDYIGLNQTGWLAVKERHEPMHQLSMRWEFGIKNLQRALSDAKQNGMALVEPQGDRSDWVRIPPTPGLGLIPSVHVNHNLGRFTSHGEVVYAPDSQGVVMHGHWRNAREWWPGNLETVTVTAQGGCGSCGHPKHDSMSSWFEEAKTKPSDFHEHVETLRQLADKCDVVTEIGWWDKPALVAMASSIAKVVYSYSPKAKSSWPALQRLRGPGFVGVEGAFDQIQETDLLFLDTQHDAETIYAQLLANKDKVRKYIVVHCTEIYGTTGDSGRPGLLWGIRRFLSEYKEWTVIRNDTNNYGLIVMSRLEEDRKELPGLVRKGLNYAAAYGKYLAAGRPVTSEAEYNRRMEICLLCEQRNFDSCAACGCPLEKKLAFATEECGMVKLGLPPKWIPESQEPKAG